MCTHTHGADAGGLFNKQHITQYTQTHNDNNSNNNTQLQLKITPNDA